MPIALFGASWSAVAGTAPSLAAVFPTIPPRVDYELTRLGNSLLEPVSRLGLWARQNRPAIQEAKRRFDAAEHPRDGAGQNRLHHRKDASG
jgi:hypothetical protein